MGRIGRIGGIGRMGRSGRQQFSFTYPADPARPARPARATVLCLLIAACSSPAPPGAKEYAARIAAERSETDARFRTASDSPIPAERRSELLPLAYFPIDPDYDVPARFKPTNDPTVMEMPTSTGTQRKMRRVGALEFSIKGQPLTLTAFVEADARDLNRLFVPFNDLTSGTETYPGGRYMDLDRTATDIYEVDFNRAYHPYCYYNATYECPYPPPENRLKVPVRAGERLKNLVIG
jgi:uncharacterized protein